MKKIWIFLVILVLLGLNAGIVLAEGTNIDFSGTLDISGISQMKNTDFFILPLYPDALNSLIPVGTVINWRNDVKIVPGEDVSVKLRVSYLNDTITGKSDAFTLSRGFIDFNPNNWLSLRIGKQRLAWGTGYAWNPTDILDIPRNAFTNIDDPEGVMAFRNDLTFGPVTAQFVITPQQSWETSGRAFRVKASPGGFDLSLGSVQNGLDPAVITGDFAYSISGIGLHGEILYQPNGKTVSNLTKDITNYLIGVDYNLPGGYYLALEYYHNDRTFEDVNAFKNYILSNPAMLASLNDLLVNLSNDGGITQNHFFVRGMKSFGDANLELLLIYNPDDHSLVSQPKLEYIWKQNTSLYIKGMLATGDTNSEANILPTKNRIDLGIKVSF